MSDVTQLGEIDHMRPSIGWSLSGTAGSVHSKQYSPCGESLVMQEPHFYCPRAVLWCELVSSSHFDSAVNEVFPIIPALTPRSSPGRCSPPISHLSFSLAGAFSFAYLALLDASERVRPLLPLPS